VDINSDAGIVPDNISYDIALNEVKFSYPSRPNVMVSCQIPVESSCFSIFTGGK